jgi:hypothetical protein
MESDALKLLQARRVIDAMRGERTRLEHELKMARMDVTRLRRAVVTLQRVVNDIRNKESADAASRAGPARAQAASRP